MPKEFYSPPNFIIEDIVKATLKEDFGHGHDITSSVVLPEDLNANVRMTAREECIIAGTDFAFMALKLIDPNLEINIHIKDGDKAQKGTTLIDIKGNARAIMSAERTALNFVGHMSGIASKTAQYVDRIKHTEARVTCTRKTLPLLRTIQKYSVRVGGGFNHRFGLDDTVLIKDNHIAACGSIENAVLKAREAIGHTVKIEVECDNIEQVSQAIKTKADIIMLDNMNIQMLSEAVQIAKDKAILEASGGVNIDNIKDIAETGIDYISVGGLTHSVKYSDIAFDI